MGAAVNRVLCANAAVFAAVLASYPVFYSAGIWSQATAGYVIITAGILALCGLGLVIANKIDALTGLVFYAWCGFGAILGMVTLDIWNGAREFPWVLYCLHGGVLGLGYFGARLHKALYTLVAILVIVLAGAVYGQYDQAIACCVSLFLIAMGVKDGGKTT